MKTEENYENSLYIEAVQNLKAAVFDIISSIQLKSSALEIDGSLVEKKNEIINDVLRQSSELISSIEELGTFDLSVRDFNKLSNQNVAVEQDVNQVIDDVKYDEVVEENIVEQDALGEVSSYDDNNVVESSNEQVQDSDYSNENQINVDDVVQEENNTEEIVNEENNEEVVSNDNVESTDVDNEAIEVAEDNAKEEINENDDLIAPAIEESIEVGVQEGTNEEVEDNVVSEDMGIVEEPQVVSIVDSEPTIVTEEVQNVENYDNEDLVNYKRTTDGVVKVILVNTNQYDNLEKSRLTQKSLIDFDNISQVDIEPQVIEENEVVVPVQDAVETPIEENSQIIEVADTNEVTSVDESDDAVDIDISGFSIPIVNSIKTDENSVNTTDVTETSEETIENMMEQANLLYKEGKTEEAQAMYDQISTMNKALQAQNDSGFVNVKKVA